VIDTSVIFVFTAFIIVVGFLFSRTGRDLKSFFAGSDEVPWVIAGLSLFMSFFSAGTFVAWGSIAYKSGWVAISMQWTMGLGALIAAIWIAPRWKAAGNLTAAEFIKERLGIKVQQVYIYIFMLVSLLIKGSVLYSVAILVSASLGYPLGYTTLILGICMIAYTATGGLWAVMITDILQFTVLTAAVLILIPLSFKAVGGWHQFLDKAPRDFFHLTSAEFSWEFLLAFALYHIAYIGGNWTFVQRYTSVRSTKAASRVGYLFAALYLISPVVWMMPPMIYRVLNPALSGLQSEGAYLYICKQILPAGLLGLILTGMYFSTSASANTTLNVTAAVFTNDIYKNIINPGATDRRLMQVARGSSWILGLGMIVIALVVPAIGGIVSFILSVASITGGPLLLPPIWALFSKRLTGKATLAITVFCLLMNIFMRLIFPFLYGEKVSTAAEMLLGVLLPFFLLLFFEIGAAARGLGGAPQYENYLEICKKRKDAARINAASQKESVGLEQNLFGLKMLAFSLFFVALLMFVISFFVKDIGRWLLITAALLVLLTGCIPLMAFKRKRGLSTPGTLSKH